MRAQIFVNGKPFFGRVEEQKRFRAALREILDPPPGEDLPYVFLLYGDGGIGKTTLARRFLDIAAEEVPFAGEFEALWLDWEAERRRSVALQAGREHIAPETLFDTLFAAAQREGWEKHFKTYRETLEKRRQAERAAAQVLSGAVERPDLAALRGAGAAAIAKILRLGLPIGESGEKLSRAFLEAGIRAGAERAYALRQSLEAALRAHLGVEQYDLYVNPLEGLARALADGFRRLARKRPLLVVLDTYEIVDYNDPWLRRVMRLSGPRALWVLSGRDDLVNSRPFGKTYFKGYAEDWPRRLAAVNMTQLARDDVSAYFAARVPERPLDEESLEALRRATRGIPLAAAQAAEMWEKGVALADITGEADEAAPARQIVEQMTGRYLLHAVAPEDRRALFALTLARGDLPLLRALLAPPEAEAAFDLNAELRRLERAYASVYAGEARLHDEPQAFFEAYLRHDLRRADPQVRALLERGAAALQDRLARLAAEYDLIEERLEDEDYLHDALALSDFLFWLDEGRAWAWWGPRFVESLAYSPDLRRGLLETAARGRKALSARGKRRLKAMEAAEGWRPEPEDLEARLRELARLLRQDGGPEAAERAAILDYLRGKARHRQKRYAEALAACEAAERGLPPEGETLRERLAEALDNLAEELMWPDKTKSAVYHPEAVRILRKVTAWQPENGGAWYRLGVALDDSGETEEAIAAFQKAIELDEKSATPWNGLGNVYDDLGRHEEATAAYQRAIELDEKYAAPWNGLGNVYAGLGRHEEALAAFQKAIALDEKLAYPWNGLGNVYYQQGRHEEALAAYQKAIALDEKYAYPLNNLGNVYRDLGRHEEAIAAYQKAIALDEKFAYPWNGLGLVYENRGEYEQAVDHYRKALEIDPKHKWAYANLGNVYRKQGRHEEAIATFQKAIELDEKYAAPWNGLGNVYRALGRHEEAIAAYQKAIALDEKLAYPWNGLGNVYRALGRHEEAIEAYQKAIALDEKLAAPWYGLGNVYYRQGRYEDAIAAYQKAIGIGSLPDGGAKVYNGLGNVYYQ